VKKLSIVAFKHRGNFSATMKFFNHILRRDYLNLLNKYGHEGVLALQANTPIDTGLTAMSWDYEIIEDKQKGIIELRFLNHNVQDDWANVAILLQYGHATRNGGWVEGIDYINPALKPIFDNLAEQVWLDIIE
jgi:hypothetical protein